MGHKGANKLKPKKARLTDGENMYISSIVHPGSKSPSPQSSVKGNESDKGEKKPAGSSNKKNRKGG